MGYCSKFYRYSFRKNDMALLFRGYWCFSRPSVACYFASLVPFSIHNLLLLFYGQSTLILNADAARPQIIDLGISPCELAGMGRGDSRRKGGVRSSTWQDTDSAGSVRCDIRQGRQDGNRSAGVGNYSGWSSGVSSFGGSGSCLPNRSRVNLVASSPTR